MSLRQWLQLSLLALFWGSAFIFMAIALPTFSPITIVLGRMSVAAVVLNTVLLVQGKRWPMRPSLWLQCAGLSLLSNLVPFGLVVWAQQHISASLAAILIAAAPIFTVVLAVFLLGERLTAVRALGVVLGFSGVVVLIGPDVLSSFSLRGLGELAILGAAMSYALAGFWGRRYQAIPAQMLSTMTVTMGALMMWLLVVVLLAMTSQAYDFAAGAAIGSAGSDPTAPALSLTDFFWAEGWSWSAGLAVVALGVFSTGLAYLIYYRLLAEVGVVNTSMVSFLVPLSTLILGLTFLNERLNGLTVVGMALILSGLAVLDGRLLSRLQSLSK